MSVSDITCAALTAQPTFRGNHLAWTYSDPRSGALPNIALDVVEVWSATVNDRADGSFAKVGEGITDFLHSGLVEEQTYYYWVRARDKIGGFGAYYPSGATSGVSCVALGVSGLAFGLANAKLVASVAANALTIAIKTVAGNDPSASDPVFVAFRSSTLSTGSYQVRTISSALSLVISNGSTLGAGTNAQAFRLWIVLFDDAGTLRLGVQNCQGFSLPEENAASATAEGGAGGADTGVIFYAGAAITSKPFRLLGFMTWNTGLASAGVWSAGPDVIQMYTSGVKLPGDVVKSRSNTFAGYTAPAASGIPLDNTIPQDSEGATVLALAITPTSPANLIKGDAVQFLSRATAGPLIAALFRNSSANAIGVGTASPNADEVVGVPVVLSPTIADTSSAITITLRYGGTGGVNVAVGGIAANQLFNGTLVSSIAIDEIMG